MHAQMYVRSRGLILAVGALAVLAACGSDATEPLLPGALSIVSGQDQQLPAGGVESAPIVVGVIDQFGFPLPGVTVEWTLVDGEGTLDRETSTTDSNGYAEVVYVSGGATGHVVLQASVPGVDPLQIPLQVIAAAPAAFVGIRLAGARRGGASAPGA